VKASEWLWQLTLVFLTSLLFSVFGLSACSREADTPQPQNPSLALAHEKEHGDETKKTAPEEREQKGPPAGGREAPSEGHQQPEPHEEKEPHGHEGPSPKTQEPESGSVALSPEEQDNIGLKTAAAELRPLLDVRLLNGIVKPHPDLVALVTSRVEGRVAAIHVKLGQRVKQGEDLVDVQSLDLEKAELDLIQAENKLGLAKADLERSQALVEKGIAAKKELLAAQNQHQAVLNEIQSFTRQLRFLGMSEAEIRKVRREKIVSTLHLSAPISGTIVERGVVLGQTVEPNSHLFKIVDTSMMIVEGEAFEDVLPLLKEGQQVRVIVASYPGETFHGKIMFISPTLESEKRTIPLWAEVDNHHGMLKEGFFAKLSVAVSEGAETLTIPADAVLSDKGEDFVFVETHGSYRRADILLGARDDRYVEVKKGLNPGDRVVTEGKMQLYAKYLSATRGEPALGGHGHGGHAH
jgi:membrane fusion protein, heavy metal efflux system